MLRTKYLALIIGCTVSLTACQGIFDKAAEEQVQQETESEKYDTSTLTGSAEYLRDITIANIAPSSAEEYEEAYQSASKVFEDSQIYEDFFNHSEKSQLIVTTIQVNDSSVQYSSKNTGGEEYSTYRVTLDLSYKDSSITDSNIVDVLYFMTDEGKIADAYIYKGGIYR